MLGDGCCVLWFLGFTLILCFGVVCLLDCDCFVVWRFVDAMCIVYFILFCGVVTDMWVVCATLYSIVCFVLAYASVWFVYS